MKPIIFACAGCSHAGQAAYAVALQADRKGLAEMSCLAGIAAGKSRFLRQIISRPTIVVDGCPIACAKGVFDKENIPVSQYIELHRMGVTKKQPLTETQLERALTAIENQNTLVS